jgi:hypothetical protein
VCVVGNYRLQDIQLSKSSDAILRVGLKLWPAFATWLAQPKPRFRVSYGEAKAGGEYRARTGDLLVANQALSQLS